MTHDIDLSKITMQGIHVELTEALQTAIQTKFAPVLRHDERIIRIEVRLHRDQNLGRLHHFTATAQVIIRGSDLVASSEDTDAYIALDRLADKLQQQLERRHGLRKEMRKQSQPIEPEAPLPTLSPSA